METNEIGRIVLASNSPRRRELMKLLCPEGGYCFHGVDSSEEYNPEQPAPDIVMQIAREKAHLCLKQGAYKADTVIGCDTMVFLGEQIFGKPVDDADAKRMLNALSGNVHQIWSGVCICRDGEERCFAERTDVKFYELSDEAIDGYLRVGEHRDKAAAYAIQGRGTIFVEWVWGCFYNAVGFPVPKIWRCLEDMRRE